MMERNLTVSAVCKSFGEKRVLENASMEFLPGITLLAGRSGAGKTTLLRIIAGLEKPDSGSVVLPSGRPVFMFQENRLLPSLDALENLTAVCGKEWGNEAKEFLLSLGLEEGDVRLLPSELSGGMARRVALARAILYAEKTGERVIILDEPFAGLDPEIRRLCLGEIKKRLGDRTVITVSHEAKKEEFDHFISLGED